MSQRCFTFNMSIQNSIFSLKVASPTKFLFFQEAVLPFLQSPKPETQLLAWQTKATCLPDQIPTSNSSLSVIRRPSCSNQTKLFAVLPAWHVTLLCLYMWFTLKNVQFLFFSFPLADILSYLCFNTSSNCISSVYFLIFVSLI